MAALLAHPPTQPELERLYHELGRIGAPAVGRRSQWPYAPGTKEALIALAGEMLRYDPRLLSILLQLLLERWGELDPLAMRRMLAKMRWPEALLVVLEFAKLASHDPELRYFADYLAAGHTPLEPVERFFFDAERPGSRTASRKLGRNLAPYSRWGFIATERPTSNAHTKATVGRYDARTRRRILDELVDSSSEVTLAEYLDAVDRSVSRQQAAADLRAHPSLRPVGHGRGARWRRRSR